MRFLCSVRQQATRMASSYAQVSDRRTGASQQDFEEYMRRRVNDYYRQGIKSDYELLRQLLIGAVGEEHVLLLPYELMKTDLPAFLSRYFHFMERSDEGTSIIKKIGGSRKVQERNVRSTAEKTWRLRERTVRGVPMLRLRPGRLFASLGLPTEVPLRWPDLKREHEIRLTPALEQDVMQMYEESNHALAQGIGMDLSRYGYY